MLAKILQGILKGKNVVYKDGYDIRTSFSYGTDVRIYRARIESKDSMLRLLKQTYIQEQIVTKAERLKF